MRGPRLLLASIIFGLLSVLMYRNLARFTPLQRLGLLKQYFGQPASTSSSTSTSNIQDHRSMAVVSIPVEGSPPPKVLVTGANGYLGMWVVRTLLEKGYAVRGTLRSEQKLAAVKKVFETEEWKERVEWIIVKDFAKEGAFDDAVKGIDGITHIAAPLNAKSGDPDEYLKPTVDGTRGLLQSALKFGPTVKRVVITSSVMAAINSRKAPPSSGPLTFTEEDWSDDAVELVKARRASGSVAYRAAKVLAERAAFDFVKKHKAEIGFDVTTLVPPLLVGPILGSTLTPRELNPSMSGFYHSLFGRESDDSLQSPFGWIDVRDAALAHIIALSKEEAAGERIITMGGGVTYQTTRDVAYKINPKLYDEGILPRGNPYLPKDLMYDFSNAKSKRVLGLEYRSLEETIRDILIDFEGRGWTKKRLA